MTQTANRPATPPPGASRLVDALSQVAPPILPVSRERLLSILRGGQAMNDRLQAAMMMDPGMALALFQALHRRSPRACASITDLSHAVSLLGHRVLQDLLEAPETPTDSASDQARRALHLHYAAAAQAAALGQALGRQRGRAAEEIASGALLQRPALLALAVMDPESSLRAYRAHQDGVSLGAAYGAELGCSPAVADWALFERWGLPSIAQPTDPQREHPGARGALTGAADALARELIAGWRTAEAATVRELLGRILGVPADEVSVWAHREAVTSGRQLADFGYPVAAYWLPMFDSEQPLEARDEQRLEAILTRQARAAAAQQSHTAAPAAETPAAEHPPHHPVSGPAATPAPARPPTLSQKIGLVLQKLRSECRLRRVLFATLGRDGQWLRVHLTLGVARRDPLLDVRVDVRQRHLFSQLLAKPQGLWLNADNHARFWPLVPAALHDHLDPQGFFAVSVFRDDRPLGIFYGDGAADGGRLTAAQYQQYRQLCQTASRLLAG